MFAAVLKTTENPDAALARLRRAVRAPVLVLKPEFASAPALLSYSARLAFKRFSQGTARAKTVELEWLLALAGTRHIQNAIAFGKPAEAARVVCVASVEPLPARVLREIGTPVRTNRTADLRALAHAYGLAPKALKAYAVEDLLVEKIAVAAVD